MGGREAPDEVVVGLVASPGTATDLAQAIAGNLASRIGDRLPGVRWTMRCVSDRLVVWPTDLSALVDAARDRLLGEGWHLAVCLTDLPLQTARRPVVAHASVTHGVAVLSLPALGAVGTEKRASDAIVRLVAVLAGDPHRPVPQESARQRRRRAATGRRVRELGARVEPNERGIGLIAGVVTGNIRLLLGMLRANKPWRLALRLSRALVAALATVMAMLVTSEMWTRADHLGVTRLTILAVAAVVAVVLTIVVGANLWESAPAGAAGREQVILFNVVTVTTVLLGVLALHTALLVLTIAGVWLLVPAGPLAQTLGHPASVSDVVELAWLTGSLGTVGGALGAGLESDATMREAAYGFQPDPG